jgi:glycosidase
MNNSLKFILGFLLFSGIIMPAKSISVKRLEPSSWWVGMKNPKLMLMVYGDSISTAEPIININGVRIDEIRKTDNINYLFIFLTINKQTIPGKYNIVFRNKGKIVSNYPFQLFERKRNSSNRIGFNSSDVIYLIMPDRFSKGNTDKVENTPVMLDKSNRSEPYGRHGGNLKGVENHLDYISNLGATTIWLTPVLENNQPESSYHGYAITDYYKVDPRFGTNEDYKTLAQECHQKGLKIIMDMVFNHCGDHHWWMSDLPTKDWLHIYPMFTRSNYIISTIADVHASQYDIDRTVKGWFDNSMPDLNLANPLLRTYLIQNSIWWIEYAGLDGIRMDTYPYPEKEGMAEWMKAVLSEYPNFNVVGEVWNTNSSKICYWQKDFPNHDGYNSYLPSLMDFPLMDAIQNAFAEKDSTGNGIFRLYDVIADDYLFPNTDNLVVFGENHDIGRIYTFLGSDIRNYKMAMAIITTIRGIPQIYYGSEILMEGEKLKNGDADIRKDFPGGWTNDSLNLFLKEGRNDLQNEAFNYLSKLLNYRKSSKVLQNGKLIHFIPENGVYVYFRILGPKSIMVILNNSKRKKILDTSRFNEILSKYKSGKEIISDSTINDLNKINILAKSALIIELND